MVLGTFYFKNRTNNLNDRYEMNDESISEIIKHLQSFSPTKIAVEYDNDRDDELKKNYHDFIRKKIESFHFLKDLEFV